jgi:Fe-S cluster assembly ATP-binding protein
MGQVLPDTPYSRSLLGIFLSFQNVPEIPGVSCAEYLRNVYLAHTAHVSVDTKPMTPYVFRRYIEKLCTELSLAHTFLDRDIYVGFSGGEKRKLELLQARILDPQVLVFDEIDSGMDIDTLQILTREIETLKSK